MSNLNEKKAKSFETSKEVVSSKVSSELEDENGSKTSSSSVKTSIDSQESGKRSSSILKKSSVASRKSSARIVRFTKEAFDVSVKKPNVENKSSSRPRESSYLLSSRTSRLSQMFDYISINKKRRSTFVRPPLRFKPTYQLTSKKPFDLLVVQDLMKKIVDDRMQTEMKMDWESETCVSFIRSLSDEILQEVKAMNFDRYKIVVTVTLGQKLHQSFHQSVGFLWDSETDALAKYVYDRANLFVIVTVMAVYYD